MNRQHGFTPWDERMLAELLQRGIPGCDEQEERSRQSREAVAATRDDIDNEPDDDEPEVDDATLAAVKDALEQQHIQDIGVTVWHVHHDKPESRAWRVYGGRIVWAIVGAISLGWLAVVTYAVIQVIGR